MFSVRQKIFIARGLNLGLRTLRRLGGRGMRTICRRQGVNWELDLDEGIDLSIYLLGSYEPSTVRAYSAIVRPGATVVDVGANIGAHTLHFARLVGPRGRVLAFEPTNFAFGKLQRNLELNPEYAPRVLAQQVFLGASPSDAAPAAIYSSWPVDGHGQGRHWDHLGELKETVGVRTATADRACLSAGIDRLDFVKIDTDGQELPVLLGFREHIVRFHPTILIEIAPYIYKGPAEQEFNAMIEYLAKLDYQFTDAATGRAIPRDAASLRRLILPGGGINALLVPAGRGR